MKILSVTTFVPGESDARWHRVFNIMQILETSGHEVDTVHYIVSKRQYEKLKNMKNYKNDSFVIASPFSIHIRHLLKLRKKKYDLVYGNTHLPTFCSVFGRLMGVPLIFDMHGGNVEEFLLTNQSVPIWKHPTKLFEFYLYKFIDFMDRNCSNMIICVSKKMVSYLHEKKGVPLNKMVYITNGVDLEFFRSMSNERIIEIKNKLGVENKLVFGYVGGFQKWQGVENFIKAAEEVSDEKVAFIIVGSEKQFTNGNLIFIPKVRYNRIPCYYSVCDVLVLPRPSHPATEIAAPTKFAEYAAMGKPILTTSVGDAADFVRKYNCGIVIENNNIENLIEGINKFESKSERELKKMGKNSRKLAENEFGWTKVGISLLKAIESLK